MHRSLMAMAAVAAIVGAATLAPTPASSAAAAPEPIAAPQLLHPVQFYGAGPHYGDDGWERRRLREWRRERDEARIAEAAKREAYQIEAERQQRRAWRRAQREQQCGSGPSYGHGYQRGW